MSDRAAELASRFEQECDDALALGSGCSPAQWRHVCDDEGWTVGTVVRHIAGGILFEADIILRIAHGRQPRAMSMDDIHAHNASNTGADPDQSETLDTLRANRDRAARMVRGFTDEQLDRSAPVPFLDNRTLSVRDLIDFLLIGHIARHLAGIRTSLGAHPG